MSRTKKGTKAPGFEYWSARPGNKVCPSPCAWVKKRTHKAERQANKAKPRDLE